MTRRLLTALTTMLWAAHLAAQSAPIADHHQHLIGPAIIGLLATDSGGPESITAPGLVALLDSAGIERALVLSVAYMYGSPSRTVKDEYAMVRAENDWTAAQAALYPERLRAACGFNPLKEYALDELARCGLDPGLRHAIKLHFGNADVQLDNPAHRARVREVFRAANARRMAIVVHMRASISRKRPYGAAQARLFLEQLLPLVPDIPVQVAHLAGTGPGYDDPPSDSAMAVLAEAVQRGDPRTRRLWFDVTTVADPGISPANAARLVKRIRQVGVERILYGSDAAIGENLRPRAGWAAFRRLPLTDSELDRIARNVAPHLRESASRAVPASVGQDASDRAAIQELARRFSAAYVRGDAGAMTDLYTRDAVLFPERSAAITGRDAIRRYWTLPPGRRVTRHVLSPEGITIDGRHAYDHGTFEIAGERDGVAWGPSHGKYVVVWRREGDTWRMHLDMWNSGPEKAGP
jgi:ketosteroid isomerase-like protein/predicted TIM-barrel fold metal-dependent hydrolase